MVERIGEDSSMGMAIFKYKKFHSRIIFLRLRFNIKFQHKMLRVTFLIGTAADFPQLGVIICKVPVPLYVLNL